MVAAISLDIAIETQRIDDLTCDQEDELRVDRQLRASLYHLAVSCLPAHDRADVAARYDALVDGLKDQPLQQSKDLTGRLILIVRDRLATLVEAIDSDEEDAAELDLATRCGDDLADGTRDSGAGERRVVDLVLQPCVIEDALHLGERLTTQVGYLDRVPVAGVDVEAVDEQDD